MNKIKLFIISLSVLIYAGCGGSSSGGNSGSSGGSGGSGNGSGSTLEANATGHFIDSKVIGLKYSTNSQSNKFTDVNGTFKFNTSDAQISFYVGSVLLGDYNLSNLVETNSSETNNTIIPADLISSIARNNTEDLKLKKMIRFLQSLDSDNNATNGININLSTNDLFNGASASLLDGNITSISNELANRSLSLKNEYNSLIHYKNTLADLNISINHTPTFRNFTIPTVDENNQTSFILKADLVNDAGYTVKYNLKDTPTANGGCSSTYFSYSVDGNLAFRNPPDYETCTSYTLTLEAVGVQIINGITTNYGKTTKDITIHINDLLDIGTLSYTPIVSPDTNRTWLDRNLGAQRACTSIDDDACFGYLYQWGRMSDNHKSSGYSSTTLSSASPTISTTLTPGGNFIKDNYDWTSIDTNGSIRSADWSNTNVTDANYLLVCPNGYRVPTKDELQAEITASSITDKTAAFNSFLKIPSAGYRHTDGVISPLSAMLWTSTPKESSVRDAYYLDMQGTSAITNKNRATGMSVRCIKAN